MKKNILNTILFIAFFQCAFSQVYIDRKEVILDTAQHYEVVNPQIYAMLDTLSYSLSDCIFSALHRDYFFMITILEKSTTIYSDIFTYNDHAPLEWYRETIKNNKGFFYYKNHLILVRFKRDENIKDKEQIKSLFFKIDSMQVIKYQKSEILPSQTMGIETLGIEYLFTPNDGKMKLTKLVPCKKSRYYSYTILKSDTWESVAEKFGTTVKEIQTIRGVYNPDGQCTILHLPCY